MKSIADWITKEETARRLGVKPRSIAEYVASGKLTPQKYQRPNVSGGAVNLFDPDQVDSLVQERAAVKMEIMKPASSAVAPTYRVDARQDPPPAPDQVANQFAMIAAALRPPDVSETRYMTIDEAAAYKGVSKAFIRAMLDGVPYGPHGRLVYRRDKIDKL